MARSYRSTFRYSTLKEVSGYEYLLHVAVSVDAAILESGDNEFSECSQTAPALLEKDRTMERCTSAAACVNVIPSVDVAID